MSKAIENRYAVAPSEFRGVIYEDGLHTRKQARKAKKAWKEVDPTAVIYQIKTKVETSWRVVR